MKKLAIEAINLINIAFTGLSLRAEAEQKNIKTEFSRVRITLESAMEALQIPTSEFNFNPHKDFFVSKKAADIIDGNPIVLANWTKLIGILGRWDKFNCRPTESNDFYYLQGYVRGENHRPSPYSGI